MIMNAPMAWHGLQASSGDETTLEVHVGEHPEETDNFVGHDIGRRSWFEVRLLSPTLVQPACSVGWRNATAMTN